MQTVSVHNLHLLGLLRGTSDYGFFEIDREGGLQTCCQTDPEEGSPFDRCGCLWARIARVDELLTRLEEMKNLTWAVASNNVINIIAMVQGFWLKGLLTSICGETWSGASHSFSSLTYNGLHTPFLERIAEVDKFLVALEGQQGSHPANMFELPLFEACRGCESCLPFDDAATSYLSAEEATTPALIEADPSLLRIDTPSVHTIMDVSMGGMSTPYGSNYDLQVDSIVSGDLDLQQSPIFRTPSFHTSFGPYSPHPQTPSWYVSSPITSNNVVEGDYVWPNTNIADDHYDMGAQGLQYFGDSPVVPSIENPLDYVSYSSAEQEPYIKVEDEDEREYAEGTEDDADDGEEAEEEGEDGDEEEEEEEEWNEDEEDAEGEEDDGPDSMS